MTAVALNGGLVVVSVLLSLILAEAALRLAGSAPPELSEYPVGYFVADAELGHDIARNAKEATHGFYQVFSNRFGCYDYERPVEDGYSLILGDSFTWGYTPLAKKWTTVVETRSHQFMLKCGVTGFGTRQALIKGKKVIAEVGKAPGYIIVLYIGNDLNDDFMFPHRTVIDGRLIAMEKSIDLVTGAKSFYTAAESRRRYEDYLNPPFSRRLTNELSGTRVHQLYARAKPQIRAHIDATTSRLRESREPARMPDRSGTAYTVSLSSYLHQHDRPWYNDLIEQHKRTIKEFASYAKSLEAKFLLIDAEGTLQHERLKDVVEYLRNAEGAYYYNLAADYPKPTTLPGDGHWDVDANQKAGEYIYHHFRKAGVFR